MHRSKAHISIHHLFFLHVLVVLTWACTPDVPSGRPEILIVIEEQALIHVSFSCEVVDNGGFDIIEQGVCLSTNQSPTIEDSTILENTIDEEFSVKIDGLILEQEYYIRAFARNLFGTSYSEQLIFSIPGSIFNDPRDGNKYELVKIGDQIWMAENLRASNYPDGSAIPYVTDNSAWENLDDDNTDDAYCFYNNNSSNEYGALYTYAAALNACPDGWHLPSDVEWTELENYLADNGYNYDGTTGGGRHKIAKAMATASDWSSSSTTGSVGNRDYHAKRNESGFSALPGGGRFRHRGEFLNVGLKGYWWSSTESSSTNAYSRSLNYGNANVDRSNDLKSYGFSVRCVKDD